MDIVDVQSVTKTYRVGVGRARVREMLPFPFDRGVQRIFPKWWSRNTFDALDNVTMSIPPGSSTAIVGHNGAGKTTLLKVIAGVTEPTRGSAEVRGRTAALIDALVGFHPDLTGRENVFLLASIHGVPRKQLEPRMDQILAFAEIDEMADTPVKRFSAGMAARLGFAVVTALDPQILLIDEILAVGDATFQRKCIQWLDEYRNDGGTLLFVSHNLGLVRSMTQRVIWLDHGRIVADGLTKDVLAEYAQAMERRDFTAHTRKRKDARKAIRTTAGSRWGAGGVRVDEVHFEEHRNGAGMGLSISITYDADAVDTAVFCVGFVDEGGHEIGAAVSAPVTLAGAHGSVACEIHALPLRAGIYFPLVAILSPDGLVRDRWKLDRAVVVEERSDERESYLLELGPVDFAAEWPSADIPRRVGEVS